MSLLKIFSDGGARGNPGPAACAFIIEKDNKRIYKDAKYLGETTNNVAEYSGVQMALEFLTKYDLSGVEKITFYLDSELVVKQLNGVYKIKNVNLKKYSLRINKYILAINVAVEILHIKRDKNKIADKLLNDVLDEKTL